MIKIEIIWNYFINVIFALAIGLIMFRLFPRIFLGGFNFKWGFLYVLLLGGLVTSYQLGIVNNALLRILLVVLLSGTMSYFAAKYKQNDNSSNP